MSTANSTLLSAVAGNRQRLDGGSMFGNVPRGVWETWATPDERGRIELACRAMLIEHKGMRILCETGIGVFFDPKMADRFGVFEKDHVLLKSLGALGITESEIDVVILSHLHFDHAGGLLPPYAEITAGHDRLLFSKARYVIGKEALARAKKPHARDRASFIPGLVEKLEASGRMVVVDGDKVPGLLEDRLSFFVSQGHTPGHMHTVFKGDRESVIFAGDLVPGTFWVHAPVTMGYDRFPELLIDEKVALYERLGRDDAWLFFTHDPQWAISKVRADAKGKYTAENSIDSLIRRPI